MIAEKHELFLFLSFMFGRLIATTGCYSGLFQSHSKGQHVLNECMSDSCVQ